MPKDALKQTVEQALKDALGAAAVERVRVSEETDHDGEPALFVTVHYRRGTDTVDQTKALSTVRDRLLAAGEKRFPYLYHIYPDDPVADDAA